MQTSQMISVIREKAIEANPEIVELKFGCEISVYGKIEVVVNGPSPWGGVSTETYSDVQIPNIERVIGRPIRLADVLLAIARKGPQFSVDDTGDFRQYPDGNRIEDGEYFPAWNLRSDDLSLQSPETIEFIYNLVK